MTFTLIQSQVILLFDFIDQGIVQAEETLALNGFPKELEIQRRAFIIASILDFLFDLCEELSQNPFDNDPRSSFVAFDL